MKTISQTMGWSVYAIGPPSGASPDQLRGCDVGDAAGQCDDEDPRAERRHPGRPLERDRDDDKRPDRNVDRSAPRLSCHGEYGRGRVPDDREGQRSEQEGLQSPHAILPSPPTTVSANACAANGHPAIVAAGDIVSDPPATSATPSAATASGPPAATTARRVGAIAA